MRPGDQESQEIPLARPDLDVHAVERHPTVGVRESHPAHRHRRDVASTGHAATNAPTATAQAASGRAAAHQSDAAARPPARAGIVPS